MEGGTGSQGHETSGPVNVPLMWRVSLLVAVATVSALVALLAVRLVLDASFDYLTNSLLRSLVPDGRLRLAGISASLSEELARLAGFFVSISGIGWVFRRAGVSVSAVEFRAPPVSVPWVFGMIAGGVFAVLETVGNGDPLIAVLSRTLAHGSFGTIVLVGLVWGHRRSTAWPVLGGLLLAIVLHSIGNALVALELGTPTLVFRLVLVFGVFVGAWIASRVRPDVFGVWMLPPGLNRAE